MGDEANRMLSEAVEHGLKAAAGLSRDAMGSVDRLRDDLAQPG